MKWKMRPSSSIFRALTWRWRTPTAATERTRSAAGRRTGSGKSRFVEHMAVRLGRPLITVSCHDDTSATDLLGRFLIERGDTSWQDGPVTRAVRSGAILYLEDIGEKPYRIDGLMARLRLAGILERLGGLVFGAFTEAEMPSDRPTFSVEEVLAHYAPYVNGPVASGLVYGHFPRKSTMPVGVRATLTVSGADASLVALTPVAA